MTRLICLFFLSMMIQNGYAENTSTPSADISIVSYQIDNQRIKYSIQYINNPRCELDRSSGDVYCNDAFLNVDLKNNSQSMSWANIPLKISYFDNNNFKILDAIVKTPNDEYVSTGQEIKYKIPLEDSDYPYSQQGSFNYKVVVSDKDIGSNVQDWRALKVGMTQEQVRRLLGEPTHIDDPASDNPVWAYYTGEIPFEGSRVYFGTIGPFWNQQKLVVIKWEEPS